MSPSSEGPTRHDSSLFGQSIPAGIRAQGLRKSCRHAVWAKATPKYRGAVTDFLKATAGRNLAPLNVPQDPKSLCLGSRASAR
jgi:hypothetical protein